MDIPQFISIWWENRYIHSLIILVSFFMISKIFVFVSERWILKLTAKTKTEVDDLIIKKTNKPVSLVLFLFGLNIALRPLEIGIYFGFDLDWIVSKFIESCIAIVVAYLIIKILDILINAWGKGFAIKTKSKIDEQLISLIHRFSRIFLAIVALLFVLDLWGIQVGPLLAGLGIAGIAVAFALKSTLSNIFGGISLILDKSVKVGDVIQLDPATKGKVIDVGLRSTKIKNFDNEVIIVPNGVLVDSRIQNYVLPDPSARVVVDFGVEYGSDVDKVKRVILGEIKKLKKALKDPEPQVRFLLMADFSLNFSARFWVADYTERVVVKEEATCLFYKALNKAKIGIPFPTRTVYIHNTGKKK
ncbi:mechanosensitive ion channel family protein [Candidatus Woesearchaeota archaeon]|nr:mechanosensitive ion channel family protein [Candidatus Woesearchaeota archaeon]